MAPVTPDAVNARRQRPADPTLRRLMHPHHRNYSASKASAHSVKSVSRCGKSRSELGRMERVGSVARSICSRHTRHGVDRSHFSLRDFFRGISANFELGKDFLREMNTPIHVSEAVFLPLSLCTLSPGRCLRLSPFGHSLTLGSHCEICINRSQVHVPQEFSSTQLSFFNNVHKIIPNKTFYVSLLSSSPSAVKAGLSQPSLLYAYLVTGHFCGTICPIFSTNGKGRLIMHLLLQGTSLHIPETCLKLLCENIGPTYELAVDLVGDAFCIKVSPRDTVYEKAVNVDEDAIYEAIKDLECGDELRLQIINYTQLILENKQ
ncbi:BFLF2 [human gammaherpesvirus 4]|uniref:BFLF2 n=1 Tax=Epstein-Barr virus (strain GD1) TaxID=10376 RepID=A0A0C7TNE4_EBVG|nr:BFLF2 [human gammaherpesvirus 4]CEQ34324.1 BFLF2 [human gammaherpesvirus 4]